MFIKRKVRLARAWNRDIAQHTVRTLSDLFRKGVKFYFYENEREQNTCELWCEFMNTDVGMALSDMRNVLIPVFKTSGHAAIRSYTILHDIQRPVFEDDEDFEDDVVDSGPDARMNVRRFAASSR